MLIAGESVFFEAEALVTGPARLAWMVELKTWEPVLGVFVDVDASESPGSANLGAAIAIDVVVIGVCSCCVEDEQFWMRQSCAGLCSDDLIDQAQGAALSN